MVSIVSFIDSLELIDKEGAVIVYDDPGLAIKNANSILVDELELTKLDTPHLIIQNSLQQRILGIGGFKAVNAAKILSVKRLRKGGLKQSIFESPRPHIPVTLVPLRPALCSEVSSLTLVLDEKVPVYYTLFIRPERIVIPEKVFMENIKGNELVALLLESDTRSLSTGEYVSLCLRLSKRLFGVHFIISLSLAALTGLKLDSVIPCVAKATGYPRAASCDVNVVDKIHTLIEKKIDHLVEHSWSFYMNFLIYWGVNNRGELYRRYLGLKLSG
ncbi:MAG: hypothetical protein ACP5PL_02795 [Infirmifilum sp.]